MKWIGRIGMGQQLRGAALYPLAVAMCVGILFAALKLTRADLRTPLAYSGEALFSGAVVKSVVTGGAGLREFFAGDNFNFLLVKILGLFTDHFAVALNLFYLLTFPLTTLAALYAFRQFRVSPFPALCGSLLYTFTFYHFSRGERQFLAAAYYPVPLMVMVILWVCAGRLVGRRRVILSLLVCLLVAATGGVYFSFFAGFLLLVGGSLTALRRRQSRALLAPALLILTLWVGHLANMSSAAKYSPADAESYGLKITQLLLPVDRHRVKQLALVKDEYRWNPLINENRDATLGLVGGAGFLTLVGWLLYHNLAASLGRPNREPGPLDHLSVLNLAALLLATIGGFGALFNLLVSPQIRAYNRVSVYVAFFSLFAVVYLLDRGTRARLTSRRRRVACGLGFALVLTVGLLDQIPRHLPPDYAAVRAEYRSDAEFVSQVEAAVPPGAKIFQLPAATFPEGGTVNVMGDYDHFRGFLHSKNLRWSYGAAKGRWEAEWQRQVAALPAAEMARALAGAGFAGIYLNRWGYDSELAKLEADLTAATGAAPIISRNGRLLFFKLRPA